MKIAVIGANGRLGRRVTAEALERGHDVTAYVVTTDGVDKRAHIASDGDLFHLTKDDILQYDAVISCFGSGFNADPKINEDVCLHFIKIFADCKTRIMHIIGSGSLYADESKTKHIYELDSHPAFLKNISKYATLGLEALEKSTNVNWTVVFPSINFSDDFIGNGTYEVGKNLVPLYNNDGISLVSYHDLACAMVDFLENNTYIKQAVTILSK